MKTKLLSEIRNHGAHGLSRRSLAKAEVTRPTKTPRPTAAMLLLCLLWLATSFTAQAASPPAVGNVTAVQEPYPSQKVDISYTISDPDSASANVYILVSPDKGANWTVPATNFTSTGSTFSGTGPTAVGAGVADGVSTTYYVVWNAGTDWTNNYDTNCRVRVVACDNGMVMIPAGSYVRGNYVSCQGAGDSDITDAPTNSVFVSPFLMDGNLVSGTIWRYIYNYALTNQNTYQFDNPGSWKGTNYPVETINWYDAVKWCNARSEMEGATPVYYTDNTYATIYRSGGDLPGVCMKPGANGYRLPTEAEWEKAARGGLSEGRFPFNDNYGYLYTNIVTQQDANYRGGSDAIYDFPYGYNWFDFYTDSSGERDVLGPTAPYTSPVGCLPANGYGLFDMMGNANEWCWDWYGTYTTTGTVTNPTGPSSAGAPANRITRGGSWLEYATALRCADRGQVAPNTSNWTIGFRCVRGF